MRKIVKKIFGTLALALVPAAALADINAHDIGRYGAGVAVNSAAMIPAMYNGVLKNTTPAFIVAGASGVVGPVSSTDNAVARFDSTTGKILQNSVVLVSDLGAITGVTTLAASSTITETRTPTADSAATNNGVAVVLTTPIDTTGTNIHNGVDVALTIGNASGGTNSANGVSVENVTGDAQVNVTGVKIGTGTTLGTSNAIQVGTGWDAGFVTDSPVQINSTDGTAISALRFAFDAVANGQTSKTTTVTGATASSRCVATAAEVATNAVYIRAAVPGTNQVIVTVSADPGASNLDYTVVCFN